MLDLNDVDLASLCEALEDQSWDQTWWLDPSSGEVVPWSTDPGVADDDGEEHPADREWMGIDPIPSHVWYADMEDFIERVRDPRARDLLGRAIAGRGAFRRFKDTLFDFPELREWWFRFHDARAERRALEWLRDEGVVDPREAERAVSLRLDPEPPDLPGIFDPEAVARATAQDLRSLYGTRLRRVLLFGSWARGDAHRESDIDLLVVLDQVESPWRELRRIDEILDRHSVQNGTVVAALVVAERDLVQPTQPSLVRATIEGRAVT